MKQYTNNNKRVTNHPQIFGSNERINQFYSYTKVHPKTVSLYEIIEIFH